MVIVFIRFTSRYYMLYYITYMKKIISILFLLAVTGCAVPSNPELLIGKRCLVEGDGISYSWVWISDKNLTNKPSTEACELLPKKDKTK